MDPCSLQEKWSKETLYRALVPVLLVGTLIAGLASCRFLREVTNLRDVDFAIDSVANAQLADIDLSEIRSFEDLTPAHVTRLTLALARNELPLTFDLQLAARNPDENAVAARLVTMDWTLLLEDRETISGTFEGDVVIPPGETRQVTIPIELDLVRFFEENARDLVDLALAVSGRGGEPKQIKLQATPVIRTRLGDISYSEPIIIESREFGSE